MGTPSFAVPSLDMLCQKHTVVAVVTQPDRPNGRGKKVSISPVKEYALSAKIPILQPERISQEDCVSQLKQYGADVFVVAAYGQILSEELLKIPPLGCINVHGSLLPKYRGAAPIQRAILAGESIMGVTIMYMAKKMDQGDMILKEKLAVDSAAKFGDVYDKLSELGAGALEQGLNLIVEGKADRIHQDEAEATYAPKIEKQDCHIDWTKTTTQIRNQIRGLDPRPGAYAYYQDQPLKIWKAELVEDVMEGEPGEICFLDKKMFAVKTGDGALSVWEVQGPGGKRIPAEAYLRGHTMVLGDRFT